jgi:hypothetical protein
MGKKKNVIAPNDERAVVAMDKLQKEIERAEELYGDGLPFDQPRLEIGIKARTIASIDMMIQNGKDYHRLKAHLPHGEFVSCVERTSGKSHVWAWQCMKMAEMVTDAPQILTQVNILSPGQFRALTVFEKPVVEEYLKGGPLGDIPHDDVATMPRGDLEAEARRLRKTVDSMKASHRQAMQQKEDKICELDDLLNDKGPPAKEQLAETELQTLNKDYFSALMCIEEDIQRALGVLAKAERIENVTYPLLREWVNRHAESFEVIKNDFTTLQDAIKQPCIPSGEADDE